jgi:hypothetical protein
MCSVIEMESKGEGKAVRNRPGVAQRFPGGLGSKNS